MVRQRYRVHGLVVESEVVLPAVLAEPAEAPIDLTISLEHGPPGREPAEAELLACRAFPQKFRIWRSAAGYRLEAPQGVMVIDASRRGARIIASVETPADTLALLIMGPGLAAVVALSGGLVLHSSAVAINGRATVLAGPSGSGKSTLGALLCQVGYQVMADDAARVERSLRGWVVHQAAVELRLRDGAAALAPVGAARTTTDGRLAIRPPGTGHEVPATLARMLFLVRDGASDLPSLRALGSRDAAVHLLRNLRVGSWRDADVLRAQTRLVADLARSVEAFEVALPLADAPPPGLGARLHDLLGDRSR